MEKKMKRRTVLSLVCGTAAVGGGITFHALTGPVTMYIINDGDSESELSVTVQKNNDEIFGSTIAVPASTPDSPSIIERKIIDRAIRGDEYTINVSVPDRSYLSETVGYSPTCTGFGGREEDRLKDEIRVAIPATPGPRELQIDSNYCGGLW